MTYNFNSIDKQFSLQFCCVTVLLKNANLIHNNVQLLLRLCASRQPQDNKYNNNNHKINNHNNNNNNR